jgi:hypothetical protein
MTKASFGTKLASDDAFLNNLQNREEKIFAGEKVLQFREDFSFRLSSCGRIGYLFLSVFSLKIFNNLKFPRILIRTENVIDAILKVSYNFDMEGSGYHKF